MPTREQMARALERIGPTEYWSPKTKHTYGRRMIPAIDSSGEVRSRDWLEQGPAELLAGRVAQTKEGYQRLLKLMGGGGGHESEEPPPFQRPEEKWGDLIPEIANYVQPLSGGEHLVGAGRSWAKGDIPEAFIETISEAPGLGKGIALATRMGQTGQKLMPMAMDLIDPAQHMLGEYVGLHGHDHGGGDHGQGEDDHHEDHDHHEDDEHKHEEDPMPGRREIAGGGAAAGGESLFDYFGRLIPSREALKKQLQQGHAPTPQGRMFEPLIRKLMGEEEAQVAGPGAPPPPPEPDVMIHPQDEMYRGIADWIMRMSGQGKPAAPAQPGPSMPPPPRGHMYADETRPPPGGGSTGAPPPVSERRHALDYWMTPRPKTPWEF